MKITITGETDEERAQLDAEWAKLSEEDRAEKSPCPRVFNGLVEFAIVGTGVINETLPMPVIHLHINRHLGTFDLIGRLYAAIERLRHGNGTVQRE